VKRHVDAPTDDELLKFYDALNLSNNKPAILMEFDYLSEM